MAGGMGMGAARLLWSSVIWRRPGGFAEDASSPIGWSAPPESSGASIVSQVWAGEDVKAGSSASVARCVIVVQPSAPRTIRKTRDRPISRRTTISASNSTSRLDMQHGATPTQDLLIVCISRAHSASISELGMALLSGSPGLKDSTVCADDMMKIRTKKIIEKAMVQVGPKQ